MSIPIADLHCDLLCYLQADPSRTPFDPIVKCSIPQLLSGPVKRQVMAAFCETNEHSAAHGLAQANRFVKLKKEFPQIEMYLSLENGSTLCTEKDSLETCFSNLEWIRSLCGCIFYISLTWNTENRFGGGAHTKIGLKTDGEQLLEFLSGKHIAIDFSHTSDALAEEMFSYIDKKQLNIPVLASHSNFRAIRDVPRNLPDEFVKEIFNRQGVIGINFVKEFVGPNGFSPHIEHGLKLGGENHLCFGADFFYEGDVPKAFRKPSSFMPEYNHAGCYQKIIQELNLPQEIVRKLAHENFAKFAVNSVVNFNYGEI